MFFAYHRSVFMGQSAEKNASVLDASVLYEQFQIFYTQIGSKILPLFICSISGIERKAYLRRI